MYILVMAAMITVNYYIGYMIVVFVLLFAAAYIIFFSKSANEPVGAVCRRFLVGSVYSALITAVIWLPCFLQYLSSGRKTSVIENLRTSGFITDYCTVFPIILCGAFPLMCSAADVIFTKKRTSHHKLWLCMFILLSVPLVIEPVNKMWHTGSYMSFPARYAFMTVFAAVILTAYRLDKAYSYDYGKSGQGKITAVAAAVCLAVIAVYGVSTARYIDENIDIISDYTQTLSGSSASFEKICKVAAAAVICFGVIYFCYRRRFLPRRIFLLFLCAALITESMGYVRIYMTTAGIRSEETNAIQRSVFNLADKIDDDGFYRVKTNAKIFDYNMIGAMGYNSVGHYTSLTNENYMFNMKRLGYTSVWMEVGTCGGTELTDALLSIGYEISNTAPDEDREEIYSYGGYYISKTKCSLPLGIAVSENIGEEIPDDMTRAEIQQYLFEEIFGRDEQLIYGYEPAEGGYEYDSEDGYSVGEEEQLIYRIDVNGSQTLYFDCFDKLSNELTEPIYDSFSVSVNGKTVCADYPYSKENGVLKLGEFTDERVIVEINTLKDVSCASFGVFGLDTDLLEEKCSETESVGFSEKTNGLVATCESENPQTVLLAVPYDTGFDIKVNGESVAYRKALSGFIAFEIPEGSADIDISFKPTGFTAGAIISVCGVLTTAVYIITAKVKSKKQEKDGGNLKTDKNSGNIFAVAVFAMGTAAFLIVYLFPTVINMLLWKSK
jgi:uncharacterized membrane protein YfhO